MATLTHTRSRMAALLELGQSIWLDYLRRGMIRSGELAGLIDAGLRGMTSNPTIFEQGIAEDDDYDEALAHLATSGRTDAEIFEAVAVADVRSAADLFRPVYDQSNGGDGFVSIEVSPALARDTHGSIAEAERLWRAVDRPNVMIKIPGTAEGWPAIEQCLAAGININITLLFSVQHYLKVAEAYLAALEARLARGEPIHRVASVASFFVSRVDTEVDARLGKINEPEAKELSGTIGIANARLAYAAYQDVFLGGDRYEPLKSNGARVQRPLWASTGIKNPDYSDTLYVTGLVAPNTVNTMPARTLDAVADHGVITGDTVTGRASEAQEVFDKLEAVGVDLTDVLIVLEDEGVEKFAKSWRYLLEATQGQLDAVTKQSQVYPPLSRKRG